MPTMAIESAFLKDARIVIIGAGAIGSVLSYRLAQAGASVTVVERHYPGWGTTGNTFAWLNSFGKTPRDYHRLNVRSMRDHLDLMRELDGEWAHFDGGLYWEHATNEAKTQKLQGTVKRLREPVAQDRADRSSPDNNDASILQECGLNRHSRHLLSQHRSA
jgi:glycine/D-amino acid oxidase-like deaminating enzyme